jgi:hypothetical protein
MCRWQWHPKQKQGPLGQSVEGCDFVQQRLQEHTAGQEGSSSSWLRRSKVIAHKMKLLSSERLHFHTVGCGWLKSKVHVSPRQNRVVFQRRSSGGADEAGDG